MLNKQKITLLLLMLFLVSCQTTIPKEALQLSHESLKQRTLQTRKYEGIVENDVLAASAGVLQDLGFNIDESETKLGLIVGSKERDATESGQVAAAIFVALLGGGSMPIDEKQKIKASLVVRPFKHEDKIHHVRVTFQRIVWDTHKRVSKIEGIQDPKIYQDFFDRLSKSMFLEAHKI